MMNVDLDKKVARKKAMWNEHTIIGYLFFMVCFILGVFFQDTLAVYGYASFLVFIIAVMIGTLAREARYYNYIVLKVKKALSKNDRKDDIIQKLKVNKVKLMFHKDINYWVYLIEAENTNGKIEDFYIGKEGMKVANFIQHNLKDDWNTFLIREDVILSILE